jgi:transposase-like protein
VIPFFAFPPEVRRVVYTTNAIESVHTRVRHQKPISSDFLALAPM